MNNEMPAPSPYDLVIGLDRSDKRADLCLIITATGQRQNLVIDTAPEALWEWLAQLRQQHPSAFRFQLLRRRTTFVIKHLLPFLVGRVDNRVKSNTP